MGLRFDPVGGGQFKQAVKQIVEAESQPIKQLEKRKGVEEGRLKLFQDFRSRFSGFDKALADIQDFKKFRELKVDLGDGNQLCAVTIDKDKAEPGTYEIQVDQLAARTSIISNGFSSADENVLGNGFIVMNLPNGDSREIYVDDSKSSLNGVAAAINGEPDSPVRASVIKDSADGDEPWKLIVTAKKDGAANQVDFPDFYFMGGEQDFYVDDSKEARNAQITLDGFPIDLESNEAKDFLPGVNLHLKQARPDQPFTMTITEDKQKVAGKVKDLIDKVNGILGFINQQNKVDEHTDTRGTFAGDTGLQTVEYRLRNLMHEGFPVGDPEGDNFRLVFMNQIGIEFDKGGTIGFKEDKFTAALDKDFLGIAEAITGGFGFVYQMRNVIEGYTRNVGGMLPTRENSIRNRIKEIDNQIDYKTRNLERRQQSLTEQFSRLEASLGNLQRQQQSLSAVLPAGGGGGNLVSQLLGG